MEQEVRLYRKFVDIEILPSYFLEVSPFTSYDFFRLLEGSRLRNFICDVPMEIYPTLVKLFYAKLIFTNGIITYEVNKHPTPLSLEEFVEI